MQGTLQDFGLAEILQLVAQQHKTGLLRVEDGDKVLTFYFEGGTLVSSRDRRHISEDPLLDYLRSTGWVDSWKVLHLKLEVEETRKDLVDLLLEKKLVTEDDVHRILEDLAQDLVYRNYDRKQGSYRFLFGDEALRGLQHRVGLNMEGLLLEAARRFDEWPGLSKLVPGAGVMLDGVASLPSWLDARSHAVLSHLKNPMRMGELVACARVPEFDVYEIVAAALEAGLTRILEIPEAPAAAPDAPATVPQPTPVLAETTTVVIPDKPHVLPQVLPHVLPRVLPRSAHALIRSRTTLLAACALVICTACTGFLLARTIGAAFRSQQGALATQEARAQVVHGLEIYRALMGRYPHSLESLAVMRIVGPDVQGRAGIANYGPALRGQSYQLSFASGPQAKARSD